MKSDALNVCSIAIAVAVFSACSVCGAQGLPSESQKPAATKEEPREKPPAYVPPMRGAVAQVRRVGGATRGWGDVEVPLTVVIAPDHTGLTVNPAPTLYWYLSRPTPFPFVVTVIEEDAVAPLIEHEVRPTAAPGFQNIALREHGVSLKTDTDYEWSVAIVIDPLERSRDVIAQGTIRLVERSPELKARSQGRGNDDLGAVYAQSGLFYDAFDAFCQAIQSNPALDRPREMRRALLEQVALPEVASIDAIPVSGK